MPEQFVMFCIPTLDHRIHLNCFQSALGTQHLLSRNGISHGFIEIGGDPYLAKVRDKLVTIFLRNHPDATDLFFLDDDVGFPPEAALRLIRRPEDIVAGVYPKKSDALQFPCDLELQDGGLVERDGLYRAISVPTGFLRIKRHVLEKMAAAAGTYQDIDSNGNVLECFNIFDMGFHADDKKWWGEDYSFCQKWRGIGGEIWVDPDIEFTHRGGKTWGGNLRPSIDATVAQLAAQQKDAA